MSDAENCAEAEIRARQVALHPPRAYGEPLARARARLRPEDFQVDELLSFEPSDAGPHWLLRVEKREANTRWVAGELARLGGVPPPEVGYAGLKDRHALTRQWFSVPAATHDASFWRQAMGEDFKVLEVRANQRKLRRGALRGNRFRIRLHAEQWPETTLRQRLDALRARGAPNYFGAQRFGRNGSNLHTALDWSERGESPRGRGPREFALSAARACLFNAVLAARVEDGSWSRLEPGDVAILQGSNSHFPAEPGDATLAERLRTFDLHPSGPMWGRGDLATQAAVRELELRIPKNFGGFTRLLESQGLAQERRALRIAVPDLDAHIEGAWLTLAFELARGQFATAVLRELCGLGDDAPLDGEVE